MRLKVRVDDTHDVGHLSEGLHGQVFRGLMLSFGEVDVDELEGHVLLLQDTCDATSSDGECVPVQFEDHSRAMYGSSTKRSGCAVDGSR